MNARRFVFVAMFVSLWTVMDAPSMADEAFVWERFEVKGRPAFVILPEKEKRSKKNMPWVFYAPTFDRRLPSARDEGWMITRFLDHGIGVAGIDVGESYGSPAGRDHYSALYEKVVNDYQGASKPCLLARSRGGLMLYNWAADHPEKVGAIAAIYPVCNLTSYPGLAKACGAYGLSEAALREKLGEHNPVDRLQALAKAKVPIFHIHGDVDKVVPLDVNSALVAERYREFGGEMTLVVTKDQGHNMWKGFFQCQELVDFVIEKMTSKTR